MTNLETELFDFFHDKLQQHKNANGIGISSNDEETYLLTCRIARLNKNPSNALFVVCENISIIRLIDIFGLLSLEDLERITAEKMLRLYQSGDAYYWCMVDGGLKSLTFTKCKDKLYVRDFQNGDTHILSTLLETPKDFFDYTEYYFRNKKCQ